MRGDIRLSGVNLDAGGSGSRPCEIGWRYWSYIFNSGYTELSDKSKDSDTGLPNGNDADLNANALLLGGDSVITFDEDVLKYVSKNEVYHSVDNIAWSVKTDNATLAEIDTAARTYKLIKTGEYYAQSILYYDKNGVDTPFMKINYSSNAGIDWNILDETPWIGRIVPTWGAIKDLTIQNLKI